MPLSPEQIEAVIQWMNTWEQLKDTAIPMRFKEDFLHKTDNERLCERLRREKIGEELKLISKKMDRKSKQELLQNPLVKEIALKFANEFRVTELCENMWDEFVKSNEPVREWEILEFKYDGLLGRINEFVLLPDGKYTSNIQNFTYTLDEILSCKTAVIQTVKRLSDGEIFVVGDKVEEYGTISGFEILADNSMHVKCGYVSERQFMPHIANVKKARTPLFTTTDLKPIYEGDRYRVLFDDGSSYSEVATKKPVNIHYKTFSNKDAENEYITLNKPCLSVCDLLKINSMVLIGDECDVLLRYKNLLELAKAKQANS